jgi:hypothetical protein
MTSHGFRQIRHIRAGARACSKAECEGFVDAGTDASMEQSRMRGICRSDQIRFIRSKQERSGRAGEATYARPKLKNNTIKVKYHKHKPVKQ